MPIHLQSTLWDPNSPQRRNPDEEQRVVTYTIDSYGRGHGVGLSLVSAHAMGVQGFRAEHILSWFYHQSAITRLW